MKKKYDHRVPGKTPQLNPEGATGSRGESYVWQRKGFGLRGVSGLQEPAADLENENFFWRGKGKSKKLKLS